MSSGARTDRQLVNSILIRLKRRLDRRPLQVLIIRRHPISSNTVDQIPSRHKVRLKQLLLLSWQQLTLSSRSKSWWSSRLGFESSRQSICAKSTIRIPSGTPFGWRVWTRPKCTSTPAIFGKQLSRIPGLNGGYKVSQF